MTNGLKYWLDKIFLGHPRDIGESYAHHCWTATKFGCTLLWAGLACIIHALIPSMFKDTASNIVIRLHSEMMARKNKASSA